MTNTSSRRCAVYTRKSSEEGLEQDFNSLQAQREACEAFIKSQASEGWRMIKTAYDDGGLSGGTMERPALQQLLADIGEGLVDIVVVYKVDRLTRSSLLNPGGIVNAIDSVCGVLPSIWRDIFEPSPRCAKTFGTAAPIPSLLSTISLICCAKSSSEITPFR